MSRLAVSLVELIITDRKLLTSEYLEMRPAEVFLWTIKLQDNSNVHGYGSAFLLRAREKVFCKLAKRTSQHTTI
jgi:hypothetical protein